ncbi:hypothetical protein D3C87_1487070 [compost metagenome]
MRLAREVQVSRHAAAGAVGLYADGGELVRALDTVQGARFFHAQQGAAQVAVVVQRGGDQPLQRGVREVGLPGDAGRGFGLPGGLLGNAGLLVGGGHREGGTLVFGRK